jgi:hypothetical protein
VKRKQIITLTVIGVCGVLLLVPISLRRNHNQQFDTLRKTLQQNLILVDSVQAVSTALPASQAQHTTIAAALNDNLKTLSSLPVDKLDKTHAKTINQFIASEKYILSLYETNISTLSKVLTYSPADDLSVPAQVATQAAAARDGITLLLKQDIGQKLTIVAGQISLTENAHASLVKASGCFDALSHGTTTVKQCVATYRAARQALNEGLQALWTTTEMAEQRAAIALTIRQLDR